MDVTGESDLFTSSLAYSFAEVKANGGVSSGDLGLIINVASGLQIGCALYHF